MPTLTLWILQTTLIEAGAIKEVVYAFENHPEKEDVQTTSLACLTPLYSELFRQKASIEVGQMVQDMASAEAKASEEMKAEYAKLTQRKEIIMMPDGKERENKMEQLEADEEAEVEATVEESTSPKLTISRSEFSSNVSSSRAR